MAAKKPFQGLKLNKNFGIKSTPNLNQLKKVLQSESAINLETFACLWLDADITNTEDNRETEQKLRKFINYLRTFEKVDECEQAIRKIKREKIILITSGQLGRELIPRIHDLSQLIACYIYCLNETIHQEWSKEYSKIQGVFVDQTDFLEKFNNDQKARLRAEEFSSIKIVSDDTQINESLRAVHLWFQLYIEVLIRMHHHTNVKKEFIEICKKSYQTNKKELEIIDQFENSYQSDQAIQWYTRECCLYRILNKALRLQDFDMIYTLRFFITDISKQLKQMHRTSLRCITERDIFHVYRGQAITQEDLKAMKLSVGKYLSMNSFISTSLHRSIAIKFLNNSQLIDDMEGILYEISIDPKEKTKAYATLTGISHHHHEEEILIMCGALLHIDQIEKDENENIWIASVTLASEDDDQLKETLNYMKAKIDQETNLASLGQILLEMGEYNQALKYSKQMMHEAKLNEAKALEIKGKAAGLNKDFQTALDCSGQIMAIYNQIFPNECQEKGQLYSSIGAIYCQKCLYKDALIHLNKALEIQRKVLPIDHADICETYKRYADCYDEMGKRDKALEYYDKCLQSQSKILPKDHPAIAATYNDLGVVYERQGNYLEALRHYKKSLEISRKTLPPKHPEIQRTEENIQRLKLEIDTD